jgi:hypothetical protein
MTERLKLDLLTGIGVRDGNLLLTGRSGQGPVEVEITGASGPMLMAKIHASLGKLRAGSAEGLKPHFQLTGYQLRKGSNPNEIILQLNCLTDLELRFALPISALENFGKNLVKYATRHSIDEPPRSN